MEARLVHAKYGCEYYGGEHDERHERPKEKFVLVPGVCVERIWGFRGERPRYRFLIEHVDFVRGGGARYQGDEEGKCGEQVASHELRIMYVSISAILPPTFLPGLRIFRGSKMFFTSAKRAHIFSPN